MGLGGGAAWRRGVGPRSQGEGETAWQLPRVQTV